MTPAPLRVPGAMFQEIADGGGGAPALRLLARAEHSRRLACAWAVTVTARRIGGVVAEQVDEAWELLDAATRLDPAAASAVLTHPASGPALFGLLARLTRAGDAAARETEGPPVGWFTALAAAAAVRAGLPARVEWEAGGPRAALPSLGRLPFPGALPGARARVLVHADGRRLITLVDGSGARPYTPVPVPGAAVAGVPGTRRWRGAHLLHTMDGGAPLSLDVLDHAYFPDAAPHPADLDDGNTAHWEGAARQAYALLRADHPLAHEELAAGPRLLVPLVNHAPGQVSGSSAEAFGCVALSRPATGTVFAVTLVHEMQHIKLAALLHLFDLLDPSCPERFYAPWRPDPRPLLGLLHGAYAHLGVARFWDVRRASEPDPELRALAHARFARWRLAAHQAAVTALSSDGLTGLGRVFTERMATALDRLCRLPVPAEALRHAESAARAHRAAWQRRNHGDGRAPARRESR